MSRKKFKAEKLDGVVKAEFGSVPVLRFGGLGKTHLRGEVVFELRVDQSELLTRRLRNRELLKAFRKCFQRTVKTRKIRWLWWVSKFGNLGVSSPRVSETRSR